METIRNYLEHMFAAIPDSSEVRRTKEELLSMMEDKYNALLAEGKSENEAVGTVITEFGNIDEILEELNLNADYYQQSPDLGPDLPLVTADEAEEFLVAKRFESLLIAAGTMLCIICPFFVIAFGQIPFIPTTLGVVLLLIMIAIAVCLFIAGGNKTEKYKYLKKPFYLSQQAVDLIEQEQHFCKQQTNTLLVIGIGSIIISPVPVILLSGIPIIRIFSVPLLLVLVAIGVGCFIYPSGGDEACKILLKEGNRLKKSKRKH